MGETDKQYDGRLIDEYSMLKAIKKIAEKENATETVKAIEEKMNFLKLKLLPTKITD